ncbi:MAG: prolipoprotein diacylglyceryl transferase [Acidobacteria bacterium]|nr:prolipoprotein diacylglyceryl transferase [Acidobacteriota bacterium]
MIEITWDPAAHFGPVPINWYGLGWGAAFLTAALLVRRRAPRVRIPVEHVEGLLLWTLVGSLLGARLYFVVQNEPGSYLYEPWRILAIWEGGLAFFGGLFGATLAAFVYTRQAGVSFSRAADLFAPAIPIAGAVGRIACGLAGMDYGTATTLPWAVVYRHPASYAPVDGIGRHPVQFYEMAGDLVIAAVLLRMRGRLPQGGLFLLYLILFSALRFALFFVRGDVPAVAFGLTNGHWTAIAILAVALPVFLRMTRKRRGLNHLQAA